MISKRRWLAFSALVIASWACADERPDEAVIAETGMGRKVVYRQIRCNRQIRQDAEACHASEQRQLDLRLIREVMLAAADVYGIHLTADEKEAVERRIAQQRAYDRQLIARYEPIFRGVLRVRQGENADSVADELGLRDRRRDEFESLLDQIRTVEQAKRAVEKNSVAALENATRESMMIEFLHQKLPAMIRERSAQSGRSFDEEAALMWSQAIKARNIRIIDSSYKMPDLKGVLRERKQTLVF